MDGKKFSRFVQFFHLHPAGLASFEPNCDNRVVARIGVSAGSIREVPWSNVNEFFGRGAAEFLF